MGMCVSISGKSTAMDFSPGNLFASMLIGSIGFGLFIYGKKQQRLPQLVTGIVLSIYPFFVASAAWMVAIGVAVLGVLALVVRAGY